MFLFKGSIVGSVLKTFVATTKYIDAFIPGHEYATGSFQAVLFAVHIASSSSNIVLPLHEAEIQKHCHNRLIYH